jgi:hypothetical protein
MSFTSMSYGIRGLDLDPEGVALELAAQVVDTSGHRRIAHHEDDGDRPACFT